ncbi:MAG TPA: YebC/PmpR family DNA-binding transcriptional regulator [Alphaproteobacteria bacterium]
MAGHSKFKNIMHRKGKQDAIRSKQLNKVSREITVAVRSGGEDPGGNPRLRAALIAARLCNMTNDRIQRAIKTAIGSGDADNTEEIRYEGYGPHGVALIIETLTDNRNRTAPEIRSVLSKNGGSLGETNSVAFQFQRNGQIIYPLSVASADAVFEAAVEAGADNVESNDEQHIITTTIENFGSALNQLIDKFDAPLESGFVWQAHNPVNVAGDQAAAVLKLLNALDDLDDVQDVYSNAEFDPEFLAQQAA